MRTKNIFKILIAAVLMFGTLELSAQRWSARKYELHAGVGFTNFMGDVCSPNDPNKFIWVLPVKTTGYLADGILKYNLKQRHYVSASLNMGYMGAKETIQKQSTFYYRDGIAFKSFFTELAVRYEFQFIRERRRSTIYRSLGETRLKNTTFPSYIFVGVGGIFNAGKFYWNDFSGTPKGKERYNEGYVNVAPVILGGIGTKLRIDRNTYIGVEVGHRLALSDGLDNCKGKDEPTEERPWIFGKWFDQYQFVSVSLVFTMREKRNRMPNFKTIRR